MKTSLILFLILIATIQGCKNDDSNDETNTVETYIEQLKTGKYQSTELPAFSYTDIPALLKYRNETQVITNFPHNLASSAHYPECKLGMYVLWTIESIRAVSIKSAKLIKRFPSLNPSLGFRNQIENRLFDDKVAHIEAAKAYFDWWENNKQKSFYSFNTIDPLNNTVYTWN